MTVLDIGGGVGAIQLELLEAGATLATGIDASPSYVTVAEAEARRRGFDDRVQHHVGDFVDWADELEDADIVTLDRVVCCYPAMERLVALSARRARRFYGLVFPRDDWWVRLFMVVPNLFMHMTRNPFRVFVHPTEAVEAAVSGQGLRRRYHRKTAVWQVILYERA